MLSLKLESVLTSLISPSMSPGTKELINFNTLSGKFYWGISMSVSLLFSLILWIINVLW